MGMPTGIGIIDTMIGFPHGDMKEAYRFITRQTRDKESKEDFEFPVEYMFKDVPDKHLRDVDTASERWSCSRPVRSPRSGSTTS